MDEEIENVLLQCPEKISPPQLAALIANIVNMYEFPHLWPMISAQVGHMLQEHVLVTEAVEDAENFMHRITKGTIH